MRGRIRFEYTKDNGETEYIGCLPTEDLVESIKLFEEYRKLRLELFLDEEDFAKLKDELCGAAYVKEMYTTIGNQRVEENFVTVILE